MTDPRIEAAARALCADRGICPDDNEEIGRHFGKEHNWQAYIYMVSLILAAADAAAWRPMSEAPKDRTDILAKTRPDVFPESNHRSGWNSRNVVIRHDGIVNDDFDMGWSVSAPVGYGGIPDDWFLGWQPISNPPAMPQTAPETITIPELRNDRPIPGKEGADG
ncbi:hypothetical protein [Acetobacter syzygii]|uniref:hypothetical protein n=1 Tax=Acetobacter syzygii TaxID=146476 RepID=UPI00156D56CB|nr:hypothetical protein [Acetobacter syzygii]NSL93873.1 hypothetical protein [Acetobacter syzygii]